MKAKGKVTLHNILLPLWILVFWPSWLWLILIPANYLIDRVVLRWSLGDMPEKGSFCRRHTWKICIAGFAADGIGALLLFAVFMFSAVVEETPVGEIFQDIAYGVGFNPFSDILAFLIVAAAVLLAMLVIYLLDRWILKRAGLEMEQVKKSAIRLAVITAPYLFFFPSAMLYSGGI